MKWPLYGICIVFFGLLCLQAQNKTWELTKDDLALMIENADIICKAQLRLRKGKPTLRIQESIQGPQILRKILLAKSDSISQIKLRTSYIFFLKKINNSYQLLKKNGGYVKSDILVKTRVRKAVMKRRVQNSDVVVAATVNKIKETSIKDSTALQVMAECQTIEAYRGTPPINFSVVYQRIPKLRPPQVFLFSGLSYIFFLKKVAKKPYYTMISSYEGAFSQRYTFLKEVKNATENRFQQMAGKAHQGITLRIFSKGNNTKFPHKEPITLFLVLQNISSQKIDLYHHQFLYFAKFYLFNQNNKILTPKQNKMKNPKIEKRYFISLGAQKYFWQPLPLDQYYDLSPGKYVLYVEFQLPWEYSGIDFQKKAWHGTVMSNKVQIEIQ